MNGGKLESLLKAWDDATAPLDAREREDPLVFASAAEIVAASSVKKLQDATTESCRPWDHQDFLQRVSSFSIACWFAKPEPINAFQCARHGWRNSAPDQLQCMCCKQFLCFQIHDKLSKSGAMKVAEKFAEQLVTGHTELCPWRENPSPKAFTTLPIATKRQVSEMLLSRVREEVAKIRGDEKLNKKLDGLRVAGTVIDRILQEARNDGAGTPLNAGTLASKLMVYCSMADDALMSSAALVNAVLLIVCGWQYDKQNDADKHVLWCGSCNRRWELLSFSDSVVEETKESEPPTKRTKREPRVEDLLAQHRHFCPWVTERRSDQRPTDVIDEYGENDAKLWEFMKLPGWKQYAQALQLLVQQTENAIVPKPSSEQSNTRVLDPVEALESVRAVLEL